MSHKQGFSAMLFSLLALLLCVSCATGPERPQDFRGVRWGTPGNIKWLLTLFLSFTLIGFASACVQPPLGLVGWWAAEGNADDIIGGHDGILEGGATFTVGKVGQAFSFNGVDSSVVTDVILPLVGTLEVWVKPTSLESPASTQILAGTHGLNNGNDRLWIVSSGPAGGPGVAPNTLVVNIGDRFTNDLVTPNPLYAGTWTHLAVAFNYSSDSYQLYVNGTLAASSTAQRTAPTQTLRIGGGTSNFGQNFLFNGAVDEISLYNRMLSASEITAIFEAGSQGKCKSSGSCIGTGRALLGGLVTGTSGELIPGVTFTLEGSACRDASTSATGIYLFPFLANNTYTVIPVKVGCIFTPTLWTGAVTKKLALVPFKAMCQ